MMRQQVGSTLTTVNQKIRMKANSTSCLVVTKSQELFDYKGKVVFSKSEDEEYLTDNPNRRCPILDKARDHLGYKPTVDIDEGLKRSLIWYKENAEGMDA